MHGFIFKLNTVSQNKLIDYTIRYRLKRIQHPGTQREVLNQIRFKQELGRHREIQLQAKVHFKGTGKPRNQETKQGQIQK